MFALRTILSTGSPLEQLPEIVESVAIGQEISNNTTGDVRIVLFVRLREGAPSMKRCASGSVNRFGKNTSPLHVPKKIIAVADIPRTISGKISELAVRDTMHGRPVKNTEALANPEALRLFEDAELRS